MRIFLLLLCLVACLRGQMVFQVEPILEFDYTTLRLLHPGVLPAAMVVDRTLIVWPHVQPVRVYVCWKTIGPPPTHPPGGIWVGAPFMPDPRLDAFPHTAYSFGDWRGVLPDMRADFPPTPGPALFQQVDLPIPKFPNPNVAIQLFVVDDTYAAELRVLMAP